MTTSLTAHINVNRRDWELARGFARPEL